MDSNKKNQITSLVDATSFAARSAAKLADSGNGLISNSMNLAAQQTSSNYAHSRNMANSSSFRPPMEFKNLSSEDAFELLENSNSLSNRRLAL